MPWSTPTLRDVRSLVRDHISTSLPGADASVPNSVLRVMSDAQGALCHLTLQYVDWLALQLLPDTAETEWLDRHGQIWLVNADNTIGRKQATFAQGTVTFTGLNGSVVPIHTPLDGSPAGAGVSVGYETTEDITIGAGPTEGPVRALDPGAIGNLQPGETMSLSGTSTVEGVDSTATVVALTGGTDIESDDDLRERVLLRIRNPPMGGAQHDYVQWALAVPGVTRAWAASEQGIGTVTVRFMMDELRADNDGFPLPDDEVAVTEYIDTVRPVTVKDFWALAPLKQPIDVVIEDLEPNDEATRAAIEQSLKDMLSQMAAPGQTIYAAWKSHAIMEAPGVVSFRLGNYADDIMPSIGHMATLGTILHG